MNRLRSHLRVGIQSGSAAVAVLACAATSAAQVVGPQIPVWVDAAESHLPEVVYNNVHEEFLVVWYNEQNSLTSDVFARRVSLDGTLATWFAVVAVADEEHYQPAVAYNHVLDEYLVVWSVEVSLGEHDLLASLVSWNGSSIGSPFTISSATNIQHWPSVAYNPNGDEYLVAYTNTWGGGDMDVAAQRVDSDGTLLSWATVAFGGGADRGYPSAVFNPDLDQYLITYMKGGWLSSWAISGKVAAADLSGVSVASEFTVHDTFSTNVPATATYATGYATVFDASYETWARRHDSDGTPLGMAGGFVVSDIVSNIGMSPFRATAVSATGTAGYVAAWYRMDSVGGGGTTILGEILARSVSPGADGMLSTQITVVGGVETSNPWVDIACAPWGTCLVVFEHNGDILAHVLDLHIFSDGFESSDTTGWSATVP